MYDWQSRATILLLSAVLLAVPITAAGQECTIGTYADADAALSWQVIGPTSGEPFSVYVVILTEATVAAASYSISYGYDMFQIARFSGPSGNGLVIDEPYGTNVALTECVIGFGGHPVLIDEYQFVVFHPFGGAYVSVGPNESQDSKFPQFVTCNDLIRECAPGPRVLVWDTYTPPGVPLEARSFGAVKSLFRGR